MDGAVYTNGVYFIFWELDWVSVWWAGFCFGFGFGLHDFMPLCLYVFSFLFSVSLLNLFSSISST